MTLLGLLAATFAFSSSVASLQARAFRGGDTDGYPDYEAGHRRTIFYAGGEYVFDPTLNGTIYQNQMYVEQLTPVKGVTKPHPLVFLPGTLFSGASWLNTPDNRTGWASYFLNQGYAVHIVDYPSVGRSAKLPATQNYLAFTTDAVAKSLTAPEKFSDNYPQAKLHTQWPGAGIQGDPIFDAWYATQVPVPTNQTAVELATRKSMCDLLRRIGPSFLIGQAFGASFIFVTADTCPELVQGIFGIELTANPFKPISRRPYGITVTPLVYDPPVNSPSDLIQTPVGENTAANNSCILQAAPAKQLVNISRVPIAYYTSQASPSTPYDHCLAAYLWQSGCDLDWILLEERGILGNGHASFVEKNNLQIAREVVEPFLDLHSRPRM